MKQPKDGSGCRRSLEVRRAPLATNEVAKKRPGPFVEVNSAGAGAGRSVRLHEGLRLEAKQRLDQRLVASSRGRGRSRSIHLDPRRRHDEEEASR